MGGDLRVPNAAASKNRYLSSNAGTDIETIATEVPLVCDDELLDIGGSCNDSSGSSRSSISESAPGSPREVASASAGPKAKRVAALGSSESSVSSSCSSPRSLDAQSAPGQEGVSSKAPAAVAKTRRSAEAAQLVKEVLPEEDSELQAEVRQLLKQYRIENDRAVPEAGRPKDSCGPELSSQSAWIHPEQPSAQKA